MLPIVLTPGDPLGIGPEIAISALAGRAPGQHPVVLVGDYAALDAANRGMGSPLRLAAVGRVESTNGAVAVFDPGDEPSDPIEVRAVRLAVEAQLSGLASALVTGPIHKAKLAARGFEHAGHTDYLGHLCHVPRPVMAFVGGDLRVSLVTVHMPLSRVAQAVTQERVLHTLVMSERALRTNLGISAPNLVVCGLNPHAGDSGLLGHEEQTVIGPAIEQARALGVRAVGPVSAEAAFRMVRDGQGHMVVAMYHDQGLAPLKLVDFGRSVNWTLGLPIIRTSVDHGTAYDIAGKGLADASSMRSALALAERLVGVGARSAP